MDSFVIRYVRNNSSQYEFFCLESHSFESAIVSFFDLFDSKPCDYDFIEIYVKTYATVWEVSSK